jgi:hypothetical protein
MVTQTLPALLNSTTTAGASLCVSEAEEELLRQARKLFDAGFYDHSLLDIWNTAVANLRWPVLDLHKSTDLLPTQRRHRKVPTTRLKII